MKTHPGFETIASYSDNTLLMHLKASIHPYDEYLNIHELMEEYDLSVMQMTDNSTVPKFSIFKSKDSRHEMMHVLTGAFMVHLVGEQSEDAFEHFAGHCRNNLSSQASSTPSLMEDQKKLLLRHQQSVTPLIQTMGAPKRGCVWSSMLTTSEKERRTKEGVVCTRGYFAPSNPSGGVLI
jgi:hypothetical protein